ncbi:MAG: hypothetical protein QNJ46_09130 [Leptolyngbyaceae cyanobacterium MO_188.B28]|nr:hypothetical protein [Leptolyngbyaceae cyanobacterium MO_188.B28]
MKRSRFTPLSMGNRLAQERVSLLGALASKPGVSPPPIIPVGVGASADNPGEPPRNSFVDNDTFFEDDALSVPSAYAPTWKTASLSGGLIAVMAATGSYLLVNPNFSNSGPAILTKAEASLHAGNLPTALHLAESISPKSRVYPDAQVAIRQWPTTWRQAEMLLSSIETAFAEQRWRDVIAYAHQMPKIDIWQQRLNSMAPKALEYLNAAAQKQMEAANDLGRRGQFSQAIAQLQQIPVDAQVYKLAQRKMAEYVKQREILAQNLLQQADYQASIDNFAKALNYLNQIPADSSVSDLAQEKILAYSSTDQTQQTKQAATPRLLPAPGEPGELSRFENIFADRQFIHTSDSAIGSPKMPRLLPEPGEAGELSRFEDIFSNQPLLKSRNPPKQREIDIHIPISGNIHPSNHLQEITPRFISHSL